MTLYYTIKDSLENLRTNKIRTFLTLLGMVIGISSVIIIMSVGAGAQSLILNQIKGVGSNLIAVFPGASDENGPPAAVMGITVTTLKYEDSLALMEKSNVTHIIDAAAYVRGTATISWQNRNTDTSFNGTTYNYNSVEDAEVELGRFFSFDEEKSLARVVVLGSQVADDLFLGADPLGENVKIKKEMFKVIGVMKKRGVVSFQNQDDQVFIPLTTAQKILLGINHVSFIRAKIDDEKNIEQTKEEIALTLRERHNISDPSQDDFSVRSANQAMDVLKTVTSALSYFLAAIAALSLIVGGVGIMNIMLVAVNERIKEIGLRKAIGARPKNIMMQFLTETVVISLSGGIAGVIVGALVSFAIAFTAKILNYDWDLIISVFSLILATGFSVLVGLVFGIYPSFRAAKMDPIEALRYE
ncbi:FtsX-like permease family protein [Candidatus Parcubacteria bacterium]|nr:MAG: FtsX-like permease family protein [Candidatus Parcubacteria bacterium]